MIFMSKDYPQSFELQKHNVLPDPESLPTDLTLDQISSVKDLWMTKPRVTNYESIKLEPDCSWE